MDSLFWAFIGMIVSFIAIYIFISKKFDHSDLSEQFDHKRKFSKKYQMAKQGLIILRKKNSILKLYKELPTKDKEEILKKINGISVR